MSRSFEPQSSFFSVLSIASRTFSMIDLVGVEQAVDHRRHVLGAVGRPVDRRELGGVARIADGDAAQALDALGEQVDELELLLRVLVEQQVELVEGRSGDEPVVLLVHRVEHHRVGQDLVEQPAAVGPRFLAERDRQETRRPEALDLHAERPHLWLRRDATRPPCRRSVSAFRLGSLCHLATSNDVSSSRSRSRRSRIGVWFRPQPERRPHRCRPRAHRSVCRRRSYRPPRIIRVTAASQVPGSSPGGPVHGPLPRAARTAVMIAGRIVCRSPMTA